jgi:Mn2+/Fe2+ NRAMP family transporter
MGDAVALLIGGPRFLYVLLFGAVCIALQILMRYRRYVTILKWLTLALFSYVATLFMVNVDWGAFLEAFLIPSLSFDVGHVTIIVAIFGTTISPYLFFWQSAQEVEDIEAHPRRKPLTQAPAQAPSAVRRIELDTLVGMALSNVIALAIMVTAAATLNAGGITDIGSSAEAAKALAPIAGAAAEAVFALGIIGTGLLAVPVLAGSAAYALGEILHVPVGLARRFREARAFYVAIALATGIGVLFDLTPIDPIRALFWSAVINGVVAAPVMAMMMLLATRRAVMGEQVIGRRLAVFGWLATVAMAASVVAMALTSF